MGNHQSISYFCCFTTSPSSNTPSPTSSSSCLLYSQGDHHHHQQQQNVNSPTTAAEIMLEAPGCIVSSADDMSRTGRVTAMKADDVLLAGKTYFVIPVRRIHCKVSEREMETIVRLESEEKVRERKGFKGRRRSSKISPAVVAQEDEENMIRNKEELSGDDEDDGVGVGFCSQQRVGDDNNYRRRWRPVLESIME